VWIKTSTSINVSDESSHIKQKKRQRHLFC
jgi:hypothetical protein